MLCQMHVTLELENGFGFLVGWTMVLFGMMLCCCLAWWCILHWCVIIQLSFHGKYLGLAWRGLVVVCMFHGWFWCVKMNVLQFFAGIRIVIGKVFNVLHNNGGSCNACGCYLQNGSDAVHCVCCLCFFCSYVRQNNRSWVDEKRAASWKHWKVPNLRGIVTNVWMVKLVVLNCIGNVNMSKMEFHFPRSYNHMYWVAKAKVQDKF